MADWSTRTQVVTLTLAEPDAAQGPRQAARILAHRRGQEEQQRVEQELRLSEAQAEVLRRMQEAQAEMYRRMQEAERQQAEQRILLQHQVLAQQSLGRWDQLLPQQRYQVRDAYWSWNPVTQQYEWTGEPGFIPQLPAHLRQQEEQYRAALTAWIEQQRGQREQEAAARKRAKALLLSCLTPAQREKYESQGWFVVQGSKGGMYRISAQGVWETERPPSKAKGGEKHGAWGRFYCVVSQEAGMPIEDVILARKFCIECSEDRFLRIARREPQREEGLSEAVRGVGRWMGWVLRRAAGESQTVIPLAENSPRNT